MIALSNQIYRENDMIAFSKQKLVCAVALTLGLLGAVPSHAQYSSDIDLFSAVGGGGSIPNVLLRWTTLQTGMRIFLWLHAFTKITA